MANNLRTVLWRNDQVQMYEYCCLEETELGSRLDGVVVTAVDGKPMRIGYQVECDRAGVTRFVTVDAAGSSGEHHLQLAADEERVWRLNGKELPACQGFLDVDLGFTPATNSLPIRRLDLKPGETQVLTAAWVRFPEFDVIAFPQRYTCLEANRYRFESLLSDFQAELLVDELGLVQQYGQYWEAVATG